MRVITILLFIAAARILSAQEPHNITAKEAYFYQRKVNWRKTDDEEVREFLKRFKPEVYKAAINDEFKREKLINDGRQEIEAGTAAVDFSKIYSVALHTKLDEYSFSEKAFPFEDSKFAEGVPLFSNSYKEPVHLVDRKFDFGMAGFLNEYAIDYQVKVDPAVAESFINRRKKADGKIDRSIMLQIIYQLPNVHFNPEEGIFVMVQKILVWDNSTGTKLGEILLAGDGERKLFYYGDKKDWMTNFKGRMFRTNNLKKRPANFYEILTIKNGKLNGMAKGYYISGKLAYEGEYFPLSTRIKVGEWRGYNEEGLATYIENYNNGGLLHGKTIYWGNMWFSESEKKNCQVIKYEHGQEICGLEYRLNQETGLWRLNNPEMGHGQHCWQLCDLETEKEFTKNLSFNRQIVDWRYPNVTFGGNKSTEASQSTVEANVPSSLMLNRVVEGKWYFTWTGAKKFEGWQWHGVIECINNSYGKLTSTLDFVPETQPQKIQKLVGGIETNDCVFSILSTNVEELIVQEQNANPEKQSGLAKLFLKIQGEKLVGYATLSQTGELIGIIDAHR